jgi:hypothetical protein
MNAPCRAAVCLAVLLPSFAAIAVASSHSDAPITAYEPRADATDVYAFRSYEAGRGSQIVLIANYIPQEEPAGQPSHYPGPNYVRYAIRIDNNGDAIEDITFTFEFDTQYSPHPVLTDDGTYTELPLVYNHPGPITGLLDPDLGLFEPYRVTVTTVGGAGPVTAPLDNVTLGSPIFFKPLDNVASSVIPDFGAYAGAHVFDYAAASIPGLAGRVFVGPRQDAFIMNYREVFGFGGPPPGPTGDSHAGHGVLSFALEVPMAFVTSGGANPILGIWTTAEVPQTRVLNPLPTSPGDAVLPPAPGAPYVQVSRLGMPLANMLFIGVNSKDRFNATPPTTDPVEFQAFFTNPAIAVLLGAPSAGRSDLVDLFLTGLPGVNETGAAGDMLRLNTGVAPVPRDSQNPMGLFGTPPDGAGFPNGRRPADDVVDFTLQAVQGRLLGGPGPFDATDGVTPIPASYPDRFPFLNPPLAGDEEPVCVTLTRSTSVEGSPFEPVADAHVAPSRPDRIVLGLPPEPLVFLRLASEVSPTPASIRTMFRDGDRLEVVVGRPFVLP